MSTKKSETVITIEVAIKAPIIKIWESWTDPKHIIHWNNASYDWHTPRAENDLKVGGKFLSRMEARDGNMGFDFTGEYLKVEFHKHIEYKLEDGRIVNIIFKSNKDETTVTEVFEPEQENSIELQQAGWQAILDNFKRYVEASV